MIKKELSNVFRTLVKNIIDSKYEVPYIQCSDIKEFKIGKSYFYSIKNKQKFSIKYNKKTFCIYDILNYYFSKLIPLNNASTAFRKELSYLHFFEPHKENYHFIRLDICSFFHSITEKDIKNVFEKYFYNEPIHEKGTQSLLDAFIELVTYKIPKNSSNEKFRDKRVLPMGFKTSPVISNIIFRQLDIQIQKLCLDKGVIYTRYADDMLFSSSKHLTYIHSDDFIKEIRIIISQMNFKLNEHKTIKAKHTLSLNGYTIQYSDFHSNTKEIIHELRLSNKRTNLIKKMIHMIDKEKKPPNIILKTMFQYKVNWKFKPLDKETFQKYYLEQLLYKVLGYRSYLLSIIQFNKKYHCMQQETIKKYLGIIDTLEDISDNFQKQIANLEKIIERNKPFHKMTKVKIEKLGFTKGIENKLKEEGYKTLKDLYGIKKEKLMGIKYIGEKTAQNIIKIIQDESLIYFNA